MPGGTGRVTRRSRLDSTGARVAALAVALAAGAAIVWVGKSGFSGMPLTPFAKAPGAANTAPSASPELAACLAERLGAVEQMRRDGLVSDGQHETFRARAISYCQTQFPPQ
ncbi:hypothetical protein H1W37_00775 [Stappia taiwanensis]|uniref:Uncharacterized protein n=1 Tax=Stappia taiwanensis TaxID=992267 RepID=A0A838XJW6_9HYPH|nr:hypothetical protein [Stappia taiwanensis]MBA4610167.1 hypothetical protein [Stappia taiwanensis]GGE77376.1 hypothetical protein GCM10007285_01540 [Stappia taiwanensis]